MDGVHDIGGLYGLGPVVVDDDSHPPFRTRWEKVALGGTFAALGRQIFKIDENRYLKECMPPRDYLGCSYYELWLATLEANCVEAGTFTLADVDERVRGIADGTYTPPSDAPLPEFTGMLKQVIGGGISPAREVAGAPKFKVGDRVRATGRDPNRHTRLPRYARRCPGTVERVHEAFVLPDSNAHGDDERPQYVYSVRFTGRDLFGPEADPNQCLLIDAWEEYLEPLAPKP